jgi:hypothetical protein
MAVKVEVNYSVGFDGSASWNIKASDVKLVEGTAFAKAKPYDPSFVSFVLHEFIQLPKRSRPSLAQCAGWKALIKCRNDAVAAAALDERTQPVEASLFGDGNSKAQRKDKYVPRLNASQLQELREHPEVLEFAVPGANGRPPLRISTVKPAHPCDDFFVPLDGDSIEHIVMFMREAGIDSESLMSKRQYGGVGREKGVWLNGNGVLIKNVASDAESSQDGDVPRNKARRQRKFQRVKDDNDVAEERAPLETSPISSIPLSDSVHPFFEKYVVK